MDLICRKLRLSGSDRVLDIGCGYGSLANHAVTRYGCKVIGITLSPKQAAIARDLFKSPLLEFKVADWQSAELTGLGRFDKIMSVGMFEHVGGKNYSAFFKKCCGLLEPGGLMLLHSIGRSVETSIDPWVDKYVFPRGSLPTITDLQQCENQQLIIEDIQNIGADYDKTLCAWYDNLMQGIEKGAISLDEKSIRFWRYYLLTFAGAFRSRRRLQVWQVLMAKNGVIGGYRRPD